MQHLCRTHIPPTNLLLANREGLLHDMMAGDHLGHSNQEIIEFSILGEGGMSAKPLLWTCRGQILACLGDLLTECLGS